MDFDDDDIDVCTNCGSYFGWRSLKDLIEAYPEIRPFPQQCRKCNWRAPPVDVPERGAE